MGGWQRPYRLVSALALLGLLVPSVLVGASSGAEAPAWVQEVHRFALPLQPGARWSLSIDGEGRFAAEAAEPLASPVCAPAANVCATNSDACVTEREVATRCNGALTEIAPHKGPFLLVGFAGTVAASIEGGWMSSKLVYECATFPSCRPTSTVEWRCTFRPADVHFVGVWASATGECRFVSWNSNLAGNAFTFHGAQEGDLVGAITHTVN